LLPSPRSSQSLCNSFTTQTFEQFAKYESEPELPASKELLEDKDVTSISVGSLTVYLKQTMEGSYIGTNHHFKDSSSGELTFIDPTDSSKGHVLKVE